MVCDLACGNCLAHTTQVVNDLDQGNKLNDFVWLNNVVWERGKGSKFMDVADLPYGSPVCAALYIKGNSMKKIILVLLFLVMHEYTFAANYGHTGVISRIVSVPAGADRDYILVDGFQSAGSCPVTSGLVIAKFPSGDAGNRSYALAMAAKMAKTLGTTRAVDWQPIYFGCLGGNIV